MRRTRSRATPFRLTAVLLSLTLPLLGCPPLAPGLAPQPGDRDYQRDTQVPLRLAGASGHVDVMGGNLLLRRTDLSIDTRLGTLEIGATYNSASTRWRWSFELRYGTRFFTDESGASYDISQLADGDAIPGSHWVKLDAQRMKTKSGRVHHFGATRELEAISWGQADWPRLVVVREPVAGRERPVAIDQCLSAGACEPVYALDYDEQGRVIAILDRAGREARFSWRHVGLVTARDGLDVAEGRPGWRYEYSSGGLLRGLVNSDGEQAEVDYEHDRVTAVRRIGLGNPEDRFHYLAEVDGLFATRHWDPRGHETVYHYDEQRRLHQRWNLAVDEQTRWSWRGVRPSSRMLPDGTVSYFAWADDDLVSEIEPGGNHVTRSYAPLGTDRDEPRQRPLERMEDSLGLIEERSYDAAGRLVSIRNGALEETRLSYDGDSNLLLVTSPSGREMELLDHDDFHGRPRSAIQPILPIPGETRLFDDAGNRTLGPPLGRLGPAGVGSRSFDADRNVRSIALASGESIEIEVRSDGRRTRITRPEGEDHEMVYDPLGRLAERRERADGEWQPTHFEYDGADNRTAIVRPNGMRQEFEYDAGGHVIVARNLRNGVLEGEARFVYENGQLVESFDSLRGGSEFFQYDAAGRLRATQHADGRSTRVDYDLRGRRTARAWWTADGGLLRQVHEELDAADRVIGLRDGLSPLLERDYLGGRLSEVRYGNGLIRSYIYAGGGGPAQRLETRTAQGDIVERSDLAQIHGNGTVSIEATTTTLGGVSAITRERYTLSPPDGSESRSARVSRFEGSGPSGDLDFELGYDGRSNLVAAGGALFHYNPEGNRLGLIELPGGETLDYAWDEAGFSTRRAGLPVEWWANGRIASHGFDTFRWDVLGRPLSSTIDGVLNHSAWDGAIISDGDGLPLKLELDELAIDLQAGTRLYRHLDFRQNVKFTTDDIGTVKAHYSYSPYQIEQVLGDDSDPVQFVGRSVVGELTLMGARVYDPLAARFLSPDPIFQVVNQYAYTLGNPVQFHDRMGTSAVEQCGAAQQAPAAPPPILPIVSGSAALTAAILILVGNPVGAAAFALFAAFTAFAGVMTGGFRRPRWREEWIAAGA